MSFLQLVLSLDKTIKEIILLWRICQFDRYRNNVSVHSVSDLHKSIVSLRNRLRAAQTFPNASQIRCVGYQSCLNTAHLVFCSFFPSSNLPIYANAIKIFLRSMLSTAHFRFSSNKLKVYSKNVLPSVLLRCNIVYNKH